MLRYAEVVEVTALERLEVLRVPCEYAPALIYAAMHLPHLRSLDLWTFLPLSPAAPEDILSQLTLTAATALTQLRLHLSLAAADINGRLELPPRLQVPVTMLLTISPIRRTTTS